MRSIIFLLLLLIIQLMFNFERNAYNIKPKHIATFVKKPQNASFQYKKLYSNLEKVNRELKKEDIISKWKTNYHLRIVLSSYFSDNLQKAVLNIKQKLGQYPQFIVAGPIPRKTIKRRFTFLTSPHVDKDSREQFEVKQYRCILDVFLSPDVPLKNTEFTDYLSVKLPRFVGFKYYFEENYRDLKKEEVKNLKKKYVSKYYTNLLNAEEKKKYVDLLLENSKYMNVKWPRNFFDLYRYPLEILRHFYKKTMEKKKWYHENEQLMNKIESLSFD